MLSCSSVQVADWKKHLPMCRLLRTIDSRTEENVLKNPRGRALREEFAAYVSNIDDEVRELAVRSAFRVTQPDNLCDSHVLQIAWEHDERPSNIRQRFTLMATGVFSYEEVINSKEKPLCDMLPDLLEARKQSSKHPHGKTMMVFFFAKHHITGMHADLRKPPKS